MPVDSLLAPSKRVPIWSRQFKVASKAQQRARDLIRARTGEGRARAVARGVKMGRKPKLTPHQQKEAIKRRDHGDETLAEIGRSYNVSPATISRQITPKMCL
jgi:DNA invertase Pin-like site-specific DNA recombinase